MLPVTLAVSLFPRISGWVGIEVARQEDQREVDDRRDEQAAERKAVIASVRHQRGDRQRTDRRAELVQRLVDSECPAESDLFGRVRQHGVARGIADRAAETFEHHQDRRRYPVVRQRQRRHGKHLHDIAENGDRPVGTGPVREAP